MEEIVRLKGNWVISFPETGGKLFLKLDVGYDRMKVSLQQLFFIVGFTRKSFWILKWGDNHRHVRFYWLYS